MCYDAFHSVHNSNNSNSSKSQAYLALTEQEQSEPVVERSSILSNQQWSFISARSIESTDLIGVIKWKSKSQCTNEIYLRPAGLYKTSTMLGDTNEAD